jgi:FtsP/CotA-like multicopper oxidase with cupredoxin domain
VFAVRTNIQMFLSKMRSLQCLLGIVAMLGLASAAAFAKNPSDEVCPRPAAGSTIPEPADLRSQNGTLKVELKYRSFRDANGQMRYCYQSGDGSVAPNLRVHPGDWLILSLKNDLKAAPSQSFAQGKAKGMSMSMPMQMPMPVSDPCAGGEMTALSTNLHFHGLSVPPVCHQDDVLKTMIARGGPAFKYRFQIPPDTPPGVYWYHPHVHGFSNAQVLGGASGALIVEGIEQANPLLAGLPERVLVIRDQDLINPDAAPLKTSAVPQAPVLRDAEGDILNTGTGEGKPSKDLSINFVPVAFPDYFPAVIAMKPDERQLWRVVNASAITYLDLQILIGGTPQRMGMVSLDGVPVNEGGMAVNRIVWETHVLLPPAGRIDFVFKAPPAGTQATLITRSVDTGPAGENDPTRPLATITVKADAPEPRSALPTSPAPPAPPTSVWLGNVKPAHERKLYFSEKPSDPNNPNSPTVFMVTVDGQEPVPYDPRSAVPNITVQQGDVEDWVIENRSRELHAFHIHQIHFLLIGWNGVPVNEPFLRDTVNVPYWDGASPVYPSVKLRMDFRDPNIVGTFVYHCHLLEHEDGGMMGTIRVEPAPSKR